MPQQAYIEFCDGKWTFAGVGAYTGRLDRRELYNIRHPWEPSVAGNYGHIETEFVIPANWKLPYALHFYASDNYVSDDYRLPMDAWLGQECYVGHRFKQVLIDDQVIWEADAGDKVNPSFAVDITPYVQPGMVFKFALRIYDKVGTDVVLPGDYEYTGTTESAKTADNPRKFHTDVWWGDVAVREQDDASQPMEPRQIPSEASLDNIAQMNFPLPPFSSPFDKPIVLPLDSKDIPMCGFPISCGVPLPFGKVTDLSRVALINTHGVRIPLQCKEINSWHDGSKRWALLEFIARNGDGPYILQVDADPMSAEGLRVERDGDAVRILGGGLDVELGYLITAKLVVREADGPKTYKAIWDRIDVTDAGPIRTTVELHGKLVGDTSELGRFVMRMSVFYGVPVMKLSYRTFNDSDRIAPIESIVLDVPLAHGNGDVLWGADGGQVHRAPLAGDFELLQPNAEQWTAGDVSGRRADGWISVHGDGLETIAAVRRFWQQYPKSFAVKDGALRIGLCDARGDAELFEQTIGEAKRHDMFLSFQPEMSDEERAELLECMLEPPMLFSAEWFCASGGLGPAYPHAGAEYDDLRDVISEKNGTEVTTESLKLGLGIRDFADNGNPATKQWHNNLYDWMMGEFAEYLMSGDRRWFDRGEETALHVMNVDQCHHDEDSVNVGGIYTYSSHNHTQGGFWDAMLRQGAGFAMYYRFTGDPDAREALVSLADFIVRNNRAGTPHLSIRDYAGVMNTLVWAYEETHDERYLRHARKVLEAVIDPTIAQGWDSWLDRRRGTFMEIHGNYNYRGNVPWMCAQLAEPLLTYYRLTGDVDAARALIGFAESVVCENMTPDVPGDFKGYSHNPIFGKGSGYNMLVASLVYAGFAITGDSYFLDCVRAAYEQTVRERTMKPIGGCYWSTPAILYWLKFPNGG